MEELKIIMEGLSMIEPGAKTVFAWWCAKEVFAYLMCPVTFGIICFTVYKTIMNAISLYRTKRNG